MLRLAPIGSGAARKNLVECDRAAAVALSDRFEEHPLGCFINLEALVRITSHHCH